MAFQRFQDLGGAYYNAYNPLLAPDGPIRTISLHNERLYFAGDFNVNLFSDTLGHIGYLDYVLSIKNNLNPESSFLTALPVPAANELNYTIETQSEPYTLSLYSLAGNEVFTQTSNASSGSISVAQLANGIYILKVQSATEFTRLNV